MISLPKSMPGCVERLEQHVAREHVDAHRGDERLLGGDPAPTATRAARCCRSRRAAPRRASPRTRRSGRRRRTGRCPSAVASSGRHRLRGDGDVGASFDVRLDQIVEVHPVEVIAGEDQVVVGVVPREVPRRLPHGVGGALEPVRSCRGSARPRASRRTRRRTDRAGRSARCGG